MTPHSPWYLERFSETGSTLRRVPILRLPFIIGRQDGVNLCLDSSSVSLRHAELYLADAELMIRDLGSTNGTFLNQSRLTREAQVHEGDTLHFADLEFRLGRFLPKQSGAELDKTTKIDAVLPKMLIGQAHQLAELIRTKAVTPLFQPIIHLASEAIFGYEVLGRGDHEGLPTGITELFELAAAVAVETELSRLLRSESLADCAAIAQPARFFFNTHPAELKEEGLLESISELRDRCPNLPMTLEIHEAAVTDPQTLQQLKNGLSKLEIQLAYDDFGTGQARLLELAEAPPDYLKFDLKLIRDVDRAPPAKWRVVKALAAMARELGVVLIAEGIESHQEEAACRELGFAYGQGFLFGPPVPSEELA